MSDETIKYPANVIMTAYKPGSYEWSWHDELQDLWTRDIDNTLELLQDVTMNGIQTPVLLGNGCRVWDGHHRIAIGLALNIDIPVEFGNG